MNSIRDSAEAHAELQRQDSTAGIDVRPWSPLINLIDANLRGANLRGANLSGAILIGANLRGANLIDAGIRHPDIGTYQVWQIAGWLAVGCETHELAEWIRDADLIDARHNSIGLAGQTRALAERLWSEMEVKP